MDAVSLEGSSVEYCEISAIDPCSGPRRRSLNTRMLKKELTATVNRSCCTFAASEPSALSRSTSRSIVTVPFSTIIFWSVPLTPWLSEFFGDLLQAVPGGSKSKTNGSTKTVSIVFSIFCWFLRLLLLLAQTQVESQYLS